MPPPPSQPPPQSPLQRYLSTHPSFQHPSSPHSPLASLYSDLGRQRRSNPAAYRANLEWWKRILTDVAWQGVQSTPQHSHRLVLHLDEPTKAAWTVDEVGRPLGLGTVAADLEQAGDIVRLSTFLRSSKPIHGPHHPAGGLTAYIPTAGSVASTLIVRPLTWAFAQLGLSPSSSSSSSADGDDDDDEDSRLWRSHRGDWVVWANLERATDVFLQQHYANPSTSPLDSLLTTAKFRQKLAGLAVDVESNGVKWQPTDVDAEVLLKHLVRDRQVAVAEKGLIKLAPSPHLPPSPISVEDIGILELSQTQEKLESQIDQIEKQMAERTQRARSALAAGQRGQATSYLRARRMLEDVLAKRMASLETISSVLIKIEQAAGDIELMQAYKTSTTTLRSLLSHPSLNQERVEETLTNLSDTLADATEIDTAIRDGNAAALSAAGVGVEDVDARELEEEMQALIEEREREEREEREREEKRRREEEERGERERREREKREREKREREEERRRWEEERRRKDEVRERERERVRVGKVEDEAKRRPAVAVEAEAEGEADRTAITTD